MPFNNSYWDLFYQSMGIDPLSEDRDQQLSFFDPIHTQPTYQGMPQESFTDLGDMPWQVDIMDTVNKGALTFGSALLGGAGSILHSGADLFKRSQIAVEEWAADAAVGMSGYPPGSPATDLLRQSLDERIANDQRNNIMDPFIGIGRDIESTANEIAQRAQPELEAGGGVWKELRAGELEPVEFAQAMVNIPAGMAAYAVGGAMLPTGAVGLAARASAALLNGMAAQSFSDTYNDRIDSGDSVLSALAWGGVNATVQRKLEKIGLDAMLGKGAVAAVRKLGITDNRVASLLLGKLVSGGTEGITEYSQNFSDLITRNDKIDSENWGPTVISALTDPSSIESAFLGGAFGFLAGGVGSLPSPEMAMGSQDLAASHGGTFIDPKAAVEAADGIGADKAKSALSEVLIQQVQDPTLDLEMSVPISSMAQAVTAPEQRIKQGIRDLEEDEASQRAAITSSITPPMADALGEGMLASVRKLGDEAAQRVAEVQAAWENLSGMQPSVSMGGVDAESPLGALPPATPEEISLAVGEAAQAMGIYLTPEQLQDPSAIDWVALQRTERERVEIPAMERIAPMAELVVGAVEVEASSAIVTVAKAKRKRKPKVVVEAAGGPMRVADNLAMPMEEGNPILEAAQPVAPEVNVLANQQHNALVYEPDLSQLVLGSRTARNLDAIRDPISLSRKFPSVEAVRGYVESVYGKEAVDKSHRMKELINKLGAVAAAVDIAFKNNALQDISDEQADTLRNIVVMAVNKIEQEMVQHTAPAGWRSEGFDIEATNRTTRLVAVDSSRGFTSIKEAAISRSSVVSAGKPSWGFPNENQLETEADARDAAPLVKRILHSVWQTGTPAEKALLGLALSHPEKSLSNRELGGVVKAHMSRNGSSILDSVDTDAVGNVVRGVGKGLMTPWGIERIMRGSGLSEPEVSSSMAVLDAMSDQWAAKTGKSVFEFYDNLGDMATLVEVLGTNVLGQAVRYSPHSVKENTTLGMAMHFGRVALFLVSGPKQNLRTPLHEFVHLLQISGMLLEMLDGKSIKAFESWIGEPLVDRAGNSLQISQQAGEKLAMGFEKFLFEAKSPNPKLNGAFRQVKEFFRQWINRVLKSLGKSIHDFTLTELWDTMDESGHKAYLFNGVDLGWRQLDLNPSVIRAYYMLLNSTPDGTPLEYSSSNGSPGLNKALELEASFKTGVSANGWLSKPVNALSNLSPLRVVDTPGQVGVEEWRRMNGITNPSTNGRFFQNGLAAIESNRERVNEIRAAGFPFKPVDKHTQDVQDVQNAFAADGTLKDSLLYEQKMDELADEIIAGGKDVFVAGAKKDASDPDVATRALRGFVTATKATFSAVSERRFGGFVKEVANQLRMKSYEKASGLWKVIERTQWNVGATGEVLYQRMGMGKWSEWLNNLHSLGKLADHVVYKLPSTWNEVKGEWSPIPGGKRWVDIDMTFTQGLEAMWESEHKNLIHGRTFKEFHGSAHRDLNLYLAAQRQIELDQDTEALLEAYEKAKKVWEDASSIVPVDGSVVGALIGPEPKKPKVPHINPASTQRARHIVWLMNARYGKDVTVFEHAAAEFNRWINMMVLDKLASVNMITQKSHEDLARRGGSYIPLNKIREMVEESGLLNVRLDESMYGIMDYLKNDVSESVQSPLDALKHRAQAFEMLTFRQHGRNAIGNRILKDFNIWDSSEHGITILSEERQITKEQYESEDLSGSKRKFQKTHKVTHEDGSTSSRLTYHTSTPTTPEEMKDQIGKIKHAIAQKAKKKSLGVESAMSDQDVGMLVESRIFTFYPEPGKPMYIWVSDRDLASALFAMNNPQATFFNSFIEKTRRLVGDDQSQDSSTRMMKKLGRGIHNGIFGYGNAAKRFITANPKFVYNQLFRDVSAALTRSRHGLMLRDWGMGMLESAVDKFPSLRELDPERHWISADASQGVGAFSGLVVQGQKDIGDVQLLSWLNTGRKTLIEEAMAGNKNAKLKLLWKDARNWMAAEGMMRTPWENAKAIAGGERVGRNSIELAVSPFTSLVVGARLFGNVFENAPRMAERHLAMYEDMEQFPQLLHHYDTSPEAKVQGKLRAGFSGVSHRKAWEKQKRLLLADPNAVVDPSTLPVQFNASERDYSMNHVTLNFSQKGSSTHSMESSHIFVNPSQQDFYTSLMILGRHSSVRKALSKWGGDKYSPLANQQKIDAQALGWLIKNFAYQFLPTLIQMAYYSGDDEESNKWWAQTFVEKMSYWHIPSPFSDKTWRVATGLGLATLVFHDLPMAAFMDATDKDPQGMSKWWDRFFDVTPIGLVLNPIFGVKDAVIGTPTERALAGGFDSAWRGLGGALLTSPLAKPGFELSTNYDQYREKPIKYSEDFNNIDKTEIGRANFNALTNSLAKKLGAQPAQAAYMIKNFLPGALGYIPWAINKGMEQTGMAEEDVQPSNSPVAGQGAGPGFSIYAKDPFGFSNEQVRLMMVYSAQAEREHNTLKDLPASRKGQYLLQHPLASEKLYWQLSNQSANVRLAEKEAKMILLNEHPEWRNDPEDLRVKAAHDLRKLYTMQSIEVMRGVLTTMLEGD